MFGRATMMLGIGPRSSCTILLNILLVKHSLYDVIHDTKLRHYEIGKDNKILTKNLTEKQKGIKKMLKEFDAKQWSRNGRQQLIK